MQIFLAFSVQKKSTEGGGSFGADFQRIRERTFKIDFTPPPAGHLPYIRGGVYLSSVAGGVYKYKKITTPNDVVII